MDVGDFYEGLQPQEYVEHDDTLGPAIITSDEEAICYLQHQIFLVSRKYFSTHLVHLSRLAGCECREGGGGTSGERVPSH